MTKQNNKWKEARGNGITTGGRNGQEERGRKGLNEGKKEEKGKKLTERGSNKSRQGTGKGSTRRAKRKVEFT